MTSITVYSDYVCPYCLLAEPVLSQAIGFRDIKISWRPFELRPYPEPTLRPEDPYLPKVWRESVYPLAEKLGVPIRLPSISPQPRTDKAFELLAYAQDQGLDHEYSMQVLRAFFQEGRDIGETEVLINIAEKVGLEAEKAGEILAFGTNSSRHREALRHAREDMLIRVVPTIVVGGQVFQGTPSLEVLRQAIDEM